MKHLLAERLPPDMLLSEREPLDLVLPDEEILTPNERVKLGLLQLDRAVAQLPGRAFGPFSLQVSAGERIAILGPSGAGKSTLLRLMSGERSPHAGSISLEGRPLQRWQLPALARRRAVLPQSHSVAFDLPVDLVVSLGRVAREPDSGLQRIVAAALQLAQASHLSSRRFDTLSGGEQARVQLARVFAQLWDEQEALLLVDEPLSALDPGLQFELMDAMQLFAAERGHALVAVLHDINQALAGFQRLWLLKEGALTTDLPSGRNAIAALEALYGIRLRCVQNDEAGLSVIPARNLRPGSHATAAANPTHQQPIARPSP